MQFSDELSFNTFSDAWQTFKTYFNDGSITFEQFYNATMERKLISRTIKDLIDNPPENIALNRIRAKSATDAYPENNRPRGLADIKSVQYHMKSTTVPIFLIQVSSFY